MDVFVIGGGASGLCTAIKWALKGYNVTILERNNKCGKKLLLTGNGRCNFWNMDQDLKYYHSQDNEILKTIYTNSNNFVLPFFDSLGLVYKNHNNYLYPISNQATSILNVLVTKAKNVGVKIITDAYVSNIIKNEHFTIITPDKNYSADIVILATGSCAYPKTGSDGNGYNLAKMFGHTIIKPLPSLVQVIGEDKFYKDWDGIRSDAILNLYENGVFKKRERGEVQLTSYGLSGIVAFNLSYYINNSLEYGKKLEIKINFVPWYLDKEPFKNWLENQNKKVGNYTLKELLECFLNYKLVNLIFKLMHLDDTVHLDHVNIDLLCEYITNFKVKIIGTKGFENAQVAMGGISLKEINPHTLESKIVKNLYFTGEILDVNGDCGGYNLGFAWMSALLAGGNDD